MNEFLGGILCGIFLVVFVVLLLEYIGEREQESKNKNIETLKKSTVWTEIIEDKHSKKYLVSIKSYYDNNKKEVLYFDFGNERYILKDNTSLKKGDNIEIEEIEVHGYVKSNLPLLYRFPKESGDFVDKLSTSKYQTFKKKSSYIKSSFIDENDYKKKTFDEILLSLKFKMKEYEMNVLKMKYDDDRIFKIEENYTNNPIDKDTLEEEE